MLYRKVLFTICLCLLGARGAIAQIQNGGFEDYVVGSGDGLFYPTMWAIANYACSDPSFTPSPELGSTVNWSYTNFPLMPYAGQRMLVLSTGDTGADSNSDRGTVQQVITFAPGETLCFRYFFGTCDYFGWNDYAKIKLIPFNPNDGLSNINMVWMHVQTAAPANTPDWDPLDNWQMYDTVIEVGDYGSMDGWASYTYTFDETTAGMYVLFFGVYDASPSFMDDKLFKSYLCVDDVRSAILPPGGDFTADGQVDAKDFAIFSSFYELDCNNPDNNCDYINLLGETMSIDYNGDGMITIDDAIPLFENWLWQAE